MSRANFKATIKDFKKNGKQMELKLLISKEDINPYALMSALDMVDSKIHVYLGDPQMSFNFSEDMNYPSRRLNVVTDQSGVVTKVSGQSDDDHEDNDGLGPDGDEGEEYEQDEGDEDEDSSDNEENTEESEGDTPDPEQQGHEEPEDNTTGDDQDTEKQEDAAASIDKEKLEAFILSGQAPAFEEIEFDFPTLLARRKAGETWIKIAPTVGTSSTKLQAAWSRYKKLVTEHMAKQNGEEPGAA